jgi:signal transduction histidine kinase/ActR/RegA family two-component response regulator
VVQLVSQLLAAPIAAVNLIAADRQWFKSEIGLGTRQMPLDDSICKFALLQEAPLIVPDTFDDPRFSCNPLVVGPPGLRFYAGALLRTSAGVPLGTLCVLDTTPRPQGLTPLQVFALTTLADRIMSQIELHKLLNDQNALIARQAQAEQALRQADQKKDEFLAMLAHELRNPLAPIASAAAILANFSIDETMVRRTSAIITRQVDHMTSLIDDLLDVSRVTRGKVELESIELDVKEVIADAVEQVRPLIQKHAHDLALQLPARTGTVIGDRKRLVQVLTNLLSNAAKYTPNGGRIDVALTTHADTLSIAVRDTGIGMTPDLIANAFDLFSQGTRGLDRSQGGLGIGLALVKSLLLLHGGSVSVHSDGPGSGSTFQVTLPLASNGSAARGQLDAVSAPGQTPPLRIGIVDDNEDAALTLALFLETCGHEVVIANTAGAALEGLPPFRPDVCLLDIGLPEMSGYDLARALHARSGTEQAVLLAVTGYAQDKDRQAALAAGFSDLLAKPVDLEALNRALRRIAGARDGAGKM